MTTPNYNFIEELRWRGMLHDMIPGTEELLNKQIVSGYIGFDPTADSLGVGNLVQVMMLLHFQKAGHKPFALVGGATGMVGDPSGKSAERNLLDEDSLNHNLNSQKAQLEKFLDFNCGENSAEIVNNYDWFKSFSFLEFIRDVGKHISVNYMLAKDSVKNRLENGMSFTEFSYQLVQGYDFYHLFHNKGCMLQMGGSDQWGNIVTGTELIRRKSQSEAFALTTPLIKKADGTKFGKTESGNVWLDPKRTSPYKFYQFWLNASDADSKNYIRIFTLFTKQETESLEAEHDAAPHERALQKALAKDITIRVHGVSEYEKSVAASSILFGKSSVEELSNIDAETLEGAFDDDRKFHFEKSLLNGELNVLDLLAVHTTVRASKGEAKREISGNAISIKKEKITDPALNITSDFLLHDKYFFIQKGKEFYLIICN